MCGIVGYIGPRDAAHIILDGLSAWSTGVTIRPALLVSEWRHCVIRRDAGNCAGWKPNGSEDPIAGTSRHRRHTRWATHGKPASAMPIPT